MVRFASDGHVDTLQVPGIREELEPKR